MAALRIVDANLNRASEGLRVVEEYCRFALNDGPLTLGCKQLRHDLTTALAAVLPRLIVARDTPADVGTQLATWQEGDRESPRQVAAANFKRVEQALRVIEEYAKVLNLPWANIEALRYRGYALAQRIENIAASQQRLAGAKLYLLVPGFSTENEFRLKIQPLAEAGVDVLQLRDKQLNDRALLHRARLLREIIDSVALPQRPLFIMNDRPDLAVLAGADGVHLGQEELTVKDARKIVGPDLLIGVSTHSLAQAHAAAGEGANYLGCGPTFPSGTKTFDHFPGIEFLRQIAAEISLPAFAIGGITRDNLAAVLATGLRRVAVSGAVWNAANPADEARKLGDLLRSTPPAAQR